jgi:IPT/TIG domain
MSEAMRALASTTTKTATVSAGLKWGAVLCGLGLLVLLYLAIMVFAGYRNPWKLVEGADGAASTSKFQWLVWLIVILFGYTALWVLRAEQGDFSALSEIPANLLIVLGFSTGTAAAAKGITSGYVQSGRVSKLTPAQAAAAAQAGAPPAAGAEPAANAGQGASAPGGVLQDDSGIPELAKIQIVGFTFVAVGIFLITVLHQIVTNNYTAGLPNIDSSLMVLMGISSGGYLGKKLVTFSAPTLYPPSPPSAAVGNTVALGGVNLGSTPSSQLLLNGSPIDATSWSNTSIKFTVPGRDPAGNAWTAQTQKVQLAVSTMGQVSNSVPFTVTVLPAAAGPATSAIVQPAAPDGDVHCARSRPLKMCSSRSCSAARSSMTVMPWTMAHRAPPRPCAPLLDRAGSRKARNSPRDGPYAQPRSPRPEPGAALAARERG